MGVRGASTPQGVPRTSRETLETGEAAWRGREEKTGEKVEVNVEELAARIAGSNLAFARWRASWTEGAVGRGPAGTAGRAVADSGDSSRRSGAVPRTVARRISDRRSAGWSRRGRRFRNWCPHLRGPQTRLRRRVQGDGGRASGGVGPFGGPFPPAGGVGGEVAVYLV